MAASMEHADSVSCKIAIQAKLSFPARFAAPLKVKTGGERVGRKVTQRSQIAGLPPTRPRDSHHAPCIRSIIPFPVSACVKPEEGVEAACGCLHGSLPLLVEQLAWAGGGT